jgi:hypothetical protein
MQEFNDAQNGFVDSDIVGKSVKSLCRFDQVKLVVLSCNEFH